MISQKLSPDNQKAMDDGIADAWKELEGVVHQINVDAISSGQLSGTREALKNNYLYRFVGAKLGLYGNSGAEAIYFGYFVDADGKLLDASKATYKLTFPKGQLPPVTAFSSLTMQRRQDTVVGRKPIERYLSNSTMLKRRLSGTKMGV